MPTNSRSAAARARRLAALRSQWWLRLRDLAGAAAVPIAYLVMAALSAVYAVLRLLPQRNTVVLMSRLYSHTSHDFAAVRDEVLRQDPTARVVVLNHRNTNPLAVPLQLLSETYHLATARACLTDSYMVPISVLKHRESLVIVQMWHALGAIKRFGLAALGSAEGRAGRFARAMRMHGGYDWVIAGGPGMIGPFAECFGVAQSQVLPLGTPRVDALEDAAELAATARRIRAAHPGLGERPLVLYAPTFRKGEPVHVEPLLDALAATGLDVALALHPLDGRDFSDRPGVTQDARISSLSWLAVADHFVTDYSAVVFDAAVVGVPSYFYVPDVADYRERRGLFLDPERDLPGPASTDAMELAAAIRSGVAADYAEALARFRTEYVPWTDGGCTRRIVELALGADPKEPGWPG